jgi:hypothetical protein
VGITIFFTTATQTGKLDMVDGVVGDEEQPLLSQFWRHSVVSRDGAKSVLFLV